MDFQKGYHKLFIRTKVDGIGRSQLRRKHKKY